MHSIASRRAALALTLALVAGSSAVASFYGMLTGFSSWDDEGNLMMTVRQFLEGGTLYRNVNTGYGPVYYFYNWVVRSVTFTAVTHDYTRFTAAAVWTLCAFGGAGIVWRFGRSLAAAAIAWLLIFRALALFRNEPGHPQELCMMLMLGVAAAFGWCDDDRWRRTALAIAGVLAAGLLLVKINIGIFAAFAIALGVLSHLQSKWLWRVTHLTALALPFALMRHNALDPREITYAAAVTLGIAGLANRPAIRMPRLGWREGAAAAAAFCATLALVLLVCAAKGITPRSLLEALVLRQWRFRVAHLTFFLPAGIGVGWLLLSMAGVAPAAQAIRRGANAARILFGIGAIGLVTAALPGNQSLAVITPWCWLVGFSDAKATLGRCLLAALAAMQTLYAYPVAGSQAPFAQVLLIVVAGVLVADGLKGQRVNFVAVTAVLATALVWAWQSERRYRVMTPLDLPGADLVRVEARQAAEYQWLTGMLRQHCDTFVGYPGIPSFYAWTGKAMPGPVNDPPGPLSGDAWTQWLTRAEQQAIIDEFGRHPNGCVVYSQAGVAFWNRSGEDESGLPLVRFIREHFVTADRMGDYQLQVRRELR